MGETSASGEKDPYMQAYITARMKNQVEEMKLQKMLSTMEVSQRVKKIMINLELFEDRKMAHKMQQEMVKVGRRQRKATSSYLQQRADRHQRTANWTSSMMVTTDHTHNLAHTSKPATTTTTTTTQPLVPAGERAIYPVTKVKGFTSAGATRDSLPEIALNSRGPSAQQPRQPKPTALPEARNTMPMIQVTDTNGEGVTLITPEPPPPQTAKPPAVSKDPPAVTVTAAAAAKAVPRIAYGYTPAAAGPAAPAAPTKTAVIITPPPLSGPRRGSHALPSRPATEPYRRSEGSVCFPPVVRARSTRTRCTRSTNTATSTTTKRRQGSASRMWPGDPRAICSVRRSRKNVEEMLAAKKAGEETRRLIRESITPCSRNCNKPNILSMMERTYVNLPDLLPEIEKARRRMRGEEVGEEGDDPRRKSMTSAEKKRHVGRFELEDEQIAGSKELPIYKIDYNKLREMGGTRRNSVLA